MHSSLTMSKNLGLDAWYILYGIVHHLPARVVVAPPSRNNNVNSAKPIALCIEIDKQNDAWSLLEQKDICQVFKKKAQNSTKFANLESIYKIEACCIVSSIPSRDFSHQFSEIFHIKLSSNADISAIYHIAGSFHKLVENKISRRKLLQIATKPQNLRMFSLDLHLQLICI